jgi:hypothetical protein
VAPNPPNPPNTKGGGGKGGGKGKGGGGGRNSNRQRIIGNAVAKLQNDLIAQGLSPSSAQSFAIMALKQQGVTIGRGGRIHYKGQAYSVKDFSNSPLLKYVTGAKAKALNEAAIKSDPNYQAAIAQLALTQQQGQAGLDAQRRSALLDFGDASYVQNDPTLAAAVGANPFSTSRLLQGQYQQNQNMVSQAANRAGTNFGGGAVSGQLEAQHQFAGSQANASSALGNLLGSLNQQGTSLSQNQALGGQQALLQTQQNLAQEGVLSASAPKLNTGGSYHLWRAQQQARRRANRPPPPPPPGGRY